MTAGIYANIGPSTLRESLPSDASDSHVFLLSNLERSLAVAEAALRHDTTIQDFSLYIDSYRSTLISTLRKTGHYHQRRTKNFLAYLRKEGLRYETYQEIVYRPSSIYDEDASTALISDALSISSWAIYLAPFADYHVSDEDYLDAIDIAALAIGLPMLMKDDYASSGLATLLVNVTHKVLFENLTIKFLIQERSKAKSGKKDKSELDYKLREYEKLIRKEYRRVKTLEGHLASSKASVKEANEKARVAIRDKDKAVTTALREQASTYSKLLNSKDAEIAKLRETIASLRKGSALDDTENSDAMCEGDALIVSDASNDRELPDKGVVFVGGHINLVKKLTAIYPNWRYYGDSSRNPVGCCDTTECVFVYYEHLSHKIFHQCRDDYPDVPLFYVSGTNLELLCNSMKEQYNTLHIEG